ncbi:ribonuclease P protein component [Muricauda sp. 2012CJ35-5]|uniref:Ribonuclease P protein component n=1 Tax=Flagellimonas spongiicola TaxID=2942208 RepID=A0ABT0PS42_9FLAO|nr:ribonuclease P protein component [Allomuricauda spongiicola]MCL6274214.1 ribonuclease P protein component [Allomuricauda spongiicola]
MKATLGKNEKLKSKILFEQLFTAGKSINAFPVKLLYANCEFEHVNFKVAVVAPKKKFKSAIKRNRIKRLLRESYRRNKSLLFNNVEGNFAFLFLYLGNKMPSANEVDNAVIQLLQAFIKKESHEKTEQ